MVKKPEHTSGEVNGLENFMFCWPCISIWSCKKKTTWCTTYS